MTTVAADLEITATNQESVDETLTVQTKDEAGVVTPMDLTGLTFLSTVKATRDIDGAVLATITATVVGDPTNGNVRLQISESVMRTLTPGDYFYDFNIRAGVGEPDCLWIAPFTVIAGVSKWT